VGWHRHTARALAYDGAASRSLERESPASLLKLGARLTDKAPLRGKTPSSLSGSRATGQLGCFPGWPLGHSSL
jgi:hypothetical protein